jgi:hypothetical protein
MNEQQPLAEPAQRTAAAAIAAGDPPRLRLISSVQPIRFASASQSRFVVIMASKGPGY